MALSATMRRFEIELADSDRGVYETLDLRVAQHPSESERFLVTRVIARALEHGDGVDFGRGVSSGEEPALWQRDLRGDVLAWIEVGSPSVDRLHKASKQSPRVAVYGWRGGSALAAEAVERGVHRVDSLEVYELPTAFVDDVIACLSRHHRWELSVTGGALYLQTGDRLLEGAVTRISIQS